MRAPYSADLENAARFSGCYVPDADAPQSITRRIIAGLIIGTMAAGGLAMVAFGVAGFTCLIGLACLSVEAVR